MKKLIANLMILLGCGCIVGGMGLYVHNYQVDLQGQAHCNTIVSEFQSTVSVVNHNPLEETVPEFTPVRNEMMMIDGDLYIGVLEIPVIDLVLPIYMDFSEQKLYKAPCTYGGSLAKNDLVIAGHNYRSHFWDLQYLPTGSEVFITNPNGQVYRYIVEVRESLYQTEVERLFDREDWDLTLFTCSFPDSAYRTVIRCIRMA